MTEDTQEFDPEAYDDAQAFVTEYGREVIDLLAPAAGERILDLGCGTGHLTASSAEAVGPSGTAIGVDASPAMIERARAAHPDLTFVCADATSYEPEDSLDAVFSNAALHWIDDQDAVLETVADALEPGGRFVAEMGAAGNIREIVDGVEAVADDRGVTCSVPWHFPTLGAYATRLERHGFEVRLARTFERETHLDGAVGLAEWLDQFGDELLAPFRDPEAAVADVENHLRPECYDASEERWTVAYRRLQFRAVIARNSPS